MANPCRAETLRYWRPTVSSGSSWKYRATKSSGLARGPTCYRCRLARSKPETTTSKRPAPSRSTERCLMRRSMTTTRCSCRAAR